MVAKAIEYILVTYLGIMSNNLSPEMTKQHQLHEGFGLIIQTVAADSPAKAAGLESGDILLQVNQQHIISPHQLRMLIRSHKPGDKVKLTIIRDNKRKTLNATLGKIKRPKHKPTLNLKKHKVVLEDRYQLNYAWDGHTIQLKAFDLKSKNSGKPIFDGPIDTQTQRDLIPEKLQEAMDKHEKTHRFPQNFDKLNFERLNKLNQKFGNFNFENFNFGNQDFDINEFDKDIQRMREQILKHRKKMELDLGKLKFDQNNLEANQFSATSVRQDEKHIISMTISNDGKSVKATDLQKKVLFEGPLNTAADYKKIPKVLFEKIKKMEETMNININPQPRNHQHKKSNKNTIRL